MSELYEEINNKESFTQKYFGLSLKKFIIALVIVIAVGVYMGILLFGENSLRILMNLDNYSNNLQVKIQILKVDNAKKQKAYFQLKEISAT